MREVLTAQEVNEYIAEQYADEIQDNEKREVATGMIDNAIVEYLCESDDLWTFIFYSQGERIESSYRSNDLYSAEEAVDKFIEAHPYAVFARFEEF